MARTLEIYPLPTGYSITVDVCALGSNVVTETITMTERTTAKLSYTGTIVTASGGDFRLNVKNSGTLIGGWTAYIGATDGLTYQANEPANVIQVNGTDQTAGDIPARLPAALVGGRMDSNMGAISTDATAADNAEAFFDGTGYAGTGNTIPTVTNTGTLAGAATVVLTDASLTTAKLGTFALAKTTNITGFNDLSAAQVNAEADTALTDAGVTSARQAKLDEVTAARMGALTDWIDGGRLDQLLDAIPTTIRLKKNTAFAGFSFPMYDTNGTPATGLTVTATRSLDGAAFASCTNSVSEISGGAYTISLSAADLNGNDCLLKFSASGAKALFIKAVLQP